jgi:phospholipid transport system substrate-binding protein
VLPPKPAALLLDVSLAGIDEQLGDVGCAAWLVLWARPCVLPPKPATLALDVWLSGAHWANATELAATELAATSAPARRSIDFMIVSADGDGSSPFHLWRDVVFARAPTRSRGNVTRRVRMPRLARRSQLNRQAAAISEDCSGPDTIGGGQHLEGNRTMMKPLIAVIGTGLLLGACNSRPQALTLPPPSMAQAPPVVFFDWDKSNLSPEAMATISQAAQAYKASGGARIVTVGNTDTSGSTDYNMALSIRRADAVKHALIENGVPAAAIEIAGRGQTNPLVPTADGIREQQNRRVELAGLQGPASMNQAGMDIAAAPVIGIVKTTTGASHEAAFRQVLRKNFDLPYMARVSLGSHWTEASEPQRARILAALETADVRAFNERLGKLAEFTLTITKVVARPNNVWIVDSLFTHPSGLSLKVEWEVRDNGQGPRITDVRMAGVSMLLTKRSEFNSYILHNGGAVEPLVEELEVRVARQ